MNDFPNIINKDGTAIYYGRIFNEEVNNSYFDELFNKIDWTNEEVVMFGKKIITKRKVAFYADKNINYTYSGRTKNGQLWSKILLKIKDQIEIITHSRYNACLLNLYHSGEEGMGWHSDDEKEIVPNGSIASLSFGADRKFLFKHKTTKETISVQLENGSLLEMKGAIQKNWLHALPKTKKISAPRINLTFRQIKP